jgi:hypothetical protein
VPFSLTLDKDTFVDPNNDTLTISVVSIPSWMRFNSTTRRLSGTPKEYGVYNVTL